MRRRTVLATTSTFVAALAGCPGLTSSTDDTSIETFTDVEAPAVTATFQAITRYSPVSETTLLVEPGRARYSVSCYGENDQGRSVVREIKCGTYQELRQIVFDSEPETWADNYPCVDDCPYDAGWHDLSVTVGDEQYETRIRTWNAEVPERVEGTQKVPATYQAAFE